MTVTYEQAKTIRPGDTLVHTVRKDPHGAFHTAKVVNEPRFNEGTRNFEVTLKATYNNVVYYVTALTGQSWAIPEAPSPQGWRKLAIEATRGTKFGAILHAVLGVEPPTLQAFGRSAIITSDGFVMANFTQTDGTTHMGAFVGSVGDLIENVDGLIRHLRMDPQEIAEFYSVMRSWISTDYRSVKEKLAFPESL